MEVASQLLIKLHSKKQSPVLFLKKRNDKCLSRRKEWMSNDPAGGVHHEQPFMGRNLIVNGAKNRPQQKAKEDATHAA